MAFFSLPHPPHPPAQVDVERIPEVDALMHITALPTFHLFVRGARVDEVKGADMALLEAKILQHTTQ